MKKLFQAENEQGAETAESTSTKKKVSLRSFLAADGSECDRIEEAQGARYVLLAPNGNKTFDHMFSGKIGTLDVMAGIMGFHTKVGNVANTVLNDKSDDGDPTPDAAATAIAAWYAGATDETDPQWAERSTGVPGSRIDKDALAGAIVLVMESDGKKLNYAKVRDKLENEPQFVRAARQDVRIANEYAKRTGKATKSVADLLGGLDDTETQESVQPSA